jgi:peptidyl-prolyl cis-trans isomerase D
MILDFIRRKTKTFLYILVPPIIIAFVAWGTMGPGDQAPERTLIEIGKDKISYDQFLTHYYNLRQRARDNFGENMTPEIEKMLNLKQQALDSMIREALLGREIERLKLAASDEEALDSLKRYPEFQTDGKFDAAKWNAAIGNPNIPWGSVAEQAKQSIKMQKLVAMVQSAARVTEDEVGEEFKRRNEKVEVEFITLRAGEIGKDIALSDEEVAAFYEEHKEEYAVPAKVKLSYVEIVKEPSRSDHEEAEEHCIGILERVKAGDDFAELAEYYSDDDATRAKGGDLGFFKKGRMTPEFEEVAFSLQPGQISDVVKTKFGYHIIKVEETKGAGEDKEVHALHILVKVEPTEDTLIDLKEKAVLLAIDATDSTLKDAAEANEMALSTTPAFSENNSFIPGIGLVSEISETLPGLREGKASDVIEGENAFYLVEVVERIPERIQELSEVEETVEAAARADRALTLAKARAEEIVAEINENGTALADVDGAPEPQQTEPFTRAGAAPGLPYVAGMRNAIFDLSEGAADGPFVSGDSVCVVVSKGKTEADPEEYEEQKDSIREEILSQRQRQIFSDYFDNLRENAGVVINENLFESV